jgi:hypothetical protein
MSIDHAKRAIGDVGRSRTALGVVAGVYVTCVVGCIFGIAFGLALGFAAAGIEGAFAGVVTAVATVLAFCLGSGRSRFCILGALSVAAGAVTAGLMLGITTAVVGGACAGTVPGLLIARDPDLRGATRIARALRAAVWVAVGAASGAAGMFILECFRNMEL